MSITTLVLIISVVGIVLGLVTVYLAIWSDYGIGKKMEKGFGELGTSGTAIAHDIDRRMGDLVEIIRMLVPQKGTETYKLTNIGSIDVSVLDKGDGITTYNMKPARPIFTSRFLVAKANENNELQEKERELFGEKPAVLHSPIPTILRAELPSEDTEICAKYMAFLLKWLDTEYLEKKGELAEAESTISKYL